MEKEKYERVVRNNQLLRDTRAMVNTLRSVVVWNEVARCGALIFFNFSRLGTTPTSRTGGGGGGGSTAQQPVRCCSNILAGIRERMPLDACPLRDSDDVAAVTNCIVSLL